MKTIVITGSNGLLGQSLVNLLLKEKENYHVIGFSKGKNRSGRADFKYLSVDITDEKDLQKNLQEIQPNYIVNTAAITNVDACENEKESCDTLNVIAVKYLTHFCEQNNCHLVHISTDFIFDGEKGNYTEEDQASPLSYYGESKLKSEGILKKSTIDFTILRTILVYGITADKKRSNIVLWVKESLEQQKEIIKLQIIQQITYH